MSEKIHFAIDRGGTFTDIYAVHQQKVFTEKLLSENPLQYQDAPAEGIRRILTRIEQKPIPTEKIPCRRITSIRMGTTVATNALLEGKGEKTALLITRGFRDLLKIGYQNRPELFSLQIKKARTCYQKVVEIDERVLPDEKNSIQVITAIDRKKINQQLIALKEQGYQSLAIVLMHSYLYPDHEQWIQELAEKIGFSNVSVSSEIMPIDKIVNRGDTTVIDAYLSPHIFRYIQNFRSRFENHLEGVELLFMQSNGGLIAAEKFRGANSILSGPAGGVIGYGSMYDKQPIIGFDMGGTSTDVSRFAGQPEITFDTMIAGHRIITPQVDILTVAAGGGSRLLYRNSMMEVGPESSGSDPGPICYRKHGFLSITDANLILGRLLVEEFPAIFGEKANLPPSKKEALLAFQQLQKEINADLQQRGENPLSIEQIALGYIEIANSNMCKPITEISVQRGYDIREHILMTFGGAGPQHACAIAKNLGIRSVYIHKDSGILSAFGMGQANIQADESAYIGKKLTPELMPYLQQQYRQMQVKLTEKHADNDSGAIIFSGQLELKYSGTEHSFSIPISEYSKVHNQFLEKHKSHFGFIFADKEIVVEKIFVQASFHLPKLERKKIAGKQTGIQKKYSTQVYFDKGFLTTDVYELANLPIAAEIVGPAILLNQGTTILVEPDCHAIKNDWGDIQIDIKPSPAASQEKERALELPIFHNLFTSIATQMGNTLQKTAVSTNIKQRLDFSCALFDACGNLIANAPHVPVHLGSMSYCIKSLLQKNIVFRQEDCYLSNSPAEGGSHLPDLTVITPVFWQNRLQFFLASRGHHADIGGSVPGSMPAFSQTLQEEGAIFTGFLLKDSNGFREKQLQQHLQQAGARKIEDNISDLKAQIAANLKGKQLLQMAIREHGLERLHYFSDKIMQVSDEAIQNFIKSLSSDIFQARDYLDDGSVIDLKITVDRKNGTICFDFRQSGAGHRGNQNTPVAVVHSCVVYALRTMIGQSLPLNEGFLQSVQVLLTTPSLLSPLEGAAVVGGNVTTSQRIVDVILKAFSIVADSCGCMNNFIFGNSQFGYYETIGGGSGAGDGFSGADGVHTHMTNTRITDPEILEARYPVLIKKFSLRKGSGGQGKYCGGEGLLREFLFRQPVEVSFLTERRVFVPQGLCGGNNGKKGVNLFVNQDGQRKKLAGKAHLHLNAGETIIIKTPGGGGFGSEK